MSSESRYPLVQCTLQRKSFLNSLRVTKRTAVGCEGPSAFAGEHACCLQLRQCFTHDSARALDVSHCVRCGDEASFKLRRREIDAAFQTSVKKTGEHFQIASLRAGEIDNRRGSKEQTKHRTEPVKGDVDLCVLDCVTRIGFKLRAQLVEQFPAVDSFEFAQLRQTGSHCDADFQTRFPPDTPDHPGKVGP